MLGDIVRELADAARSAFPAALGAAGAQAAGTVAGAPGWLIGIGQAAIVVVFVLKGIDKKLASLHSAVNEAKGTMQTLTGRVNGLRCQQPHPGCAACANKE